MHLYSKLPEPRETRAVTAETAGVPPGSRASRHPEALWPEPAVRLDSLLLPGTAPSFILPGTSRPSTRDQAGRPDGGHCPWAPRGRRCWVATCEGLLAWAASRNPLPPSFLSFLPCHAGPNIRSRARGLSPGRAPHPRPQQQAHWHCPWGHGVTDLGAEPGSPHWGASAAPAHQPLENCAFGCTGGRGGRRSSPALRPETQ